MIAHPPDRAAALRAEWETAGAIVTTYARDVVEGRVIANRYIRLACLRHLQDLELGAGRGLRFDQARAGRAIAFFRNLRLHEGQFEGKPFILEPWQGFNIGSLEGWQAQDEDGTWVRRFRNAYIETAKGSGKTPMAAGHGLYSMNSGQAGVQVFSAAAGRDQSAIAWHDADLMVEKSPALAARIQRFAHALAGPKESSFTYVSSEAKNLHGKRVFEAIIDEEHAHPGPDVIDAMRAGTKAWRDAIIFRITNSGFDRHSICWQDHEYSVNVLEGVLEDDSWFAFVAGLDMCDEHRPGGAPIDGCPGCDQWTDEAVWPKANPNIGVSLPVRYLREVVREAQGKPSAQSIVKRLNFCIWTEGSGKWLDVARFVAACDVDGPDPLPAGRTGYGGLDLSSTTDLSAFAFLAPREACPIEDHAGRCYDLRVWFWMPNENLAERVRRGHVPYDVWAREGWIELTPGNRIDRRYILRRVVGMSGQLLGLGYDRWGMDEMTRDLQDAGFDRDTNGFLLPVGQGYSSLAAPSKRLEADIATGWAHHDGNPVLSWMVANAVADQDAAGNVKPDRERSSEKIDGVAAWLDALFAWSVAPAPEEAFASVYEQPRSLYV